MSSKLSLDVDMLRNLRRSQGLSQEGLADACEQRHLRVSIATIKRAESGKQVSVRTASELARFFDIDIEHLTVKEAVSDTTVVRRPEQAEAEIPYLWTILWIRLENSEAVSEVLRLLQRRGSVWQEQLGHTVIATFGNYGVAGKGHVYAQKVALEVRRLLREKTNSPVHFYAALHLGTVRQHLGQTELSPEALQWFAEHATTIPAENIIISPELYDISHINFSYLPHNVEGMQLWLLNEEVCLERTFPLVGRSPELLQVNAILDGVGQRPRPAIAHITGPAGIGKSRFLAAVHEQAQLRQILVADVDLESGWDDPVKMLTSGLCRRLYAQAISRWSAKQLRSMLFDGEKSVERQQIIADLLEITLPEPEGDVRLKNDADPDVNERLRAMVFIFSVLLDRQIHSLLLTIDNIHLGMAAGYKLLRELLALCHMLPLTFIVTSRSETCANSELQHIANEGFHLSSLILGPLPVEDAETICGVFGKHDESYREHCIRMAEGVPLYLIQLLTNPSGKDNDLPSSLKLLVEQKLLHLDEKERQVVELLSVCGAPLPIVSIATLIGQEGFSPESLVLAQLVKVNVDLGVTLCHQLVRQIVYTSLSNAARHAYHGVLAAYIEKHLGSLHGINALSLARHFECSGQGLKAAHYISLASKGLLHNGLYDKAQEILSTALELLEALSGRDRDDLEIDVQLAMSSIYKVKYGWVSPLVKRSYQRVEALCERLGNDKRVVLALFGLWTIELATLNLKSAETLAHRCLVISQRLGYPQGSMCAYTAMANTLFWRGKHRQAEHAASEALSLYHPDYTATSIQLLGQDPRALAGCFGAWSSSLLGQAEKAERYRHNLIKDLRRLQHDFSMAIGYQGSAWLDFHHGRPEEVLTDAEKLEALSIKMGFPFYRGVSALFTGWARHKLRHDPEAAAGVEYGYHQWLASSGDKIAYSLYCTILGEIYVETERHREARQLLEQGISFAIEHGEECYLPEMYRFLSLCVEESEREACLQQGLRYADECPLFAERINRMLR